MEIKHKALRRFHHSGGRDRRGVPADLAARLARILSRLSVAEQPEELNDPGFRLHLLRGDLAGNWSIRVSGNWRVVFRFRDGKVVDVDLVDYHVGGSNMSEIQYPAHPGECLRDSVEASGLTQNEIAARLNMDRSSLHRLLTGRASITPKSALALESIGWSTAEHWMRLQAAFDLARARRAA